MRAVNPAWLLSACLVAACGDEAPRELTEDERIVLELTRQLEEMAGEQAWVDVSVIRHADGSVAYVRGVMRSSGGGGRKVVLWRDGTPMSHAEALARFDREHWQRWGRLTRPSVEVALRHPGEILPWAVVFDDERPEVRDRIRAAAAELDPNFEESRFGGAIALSARSEAIVALSRLDGVLFVVSNQMGTTTLGG